jgi:hypothetical protein
MNKPLRDCWICGAPANSREHKFKRSDLIRTFGRDDKWDVHHFIEAKQRQLSKGSKSKRVKYARVICDKCNSARSQPWDIAYETFIKYVFEHERLILGRRFINLYEVFGDDNAVESCPALYKYFVKVFGCRLANDGFAVPPHLVTLLSESECVAKLRLGFAVHKTLFAISREHRGMLGMGPLIRPETTGTNQPERYYFDLRIGWLIVGMYYDIEVPPDVGAPWTSNSGCIYLGEIENSTLDELIEIARRSKAPGLAELEALRNSGGIKVE